MAWKEGFMFSAAVILIIIFSVQTSAQFLKEPANVKKKFGTKVFIPCTISNPISNCQWVKDFVTVVNSAGPILNNNYQLADLQMGNCMLTIKKFLPEDVGNWMCVVISNGVEMFSNRGELSPADSSPSSIDMIVNNFPAVRKSSGTYKMIHSAKSETIKLSCQSKNVYPKFTAQDKAEILLNDKPLESIEQKVTDSVENPGMIDINAVAQAIIIPKEPTNVTCIVRHLQTVKSVSLLFITNDNLFDLNVQRTSLIYPDDEVKLEMKNSLEFSVGKIEYQWYHKIKDEVWKLDIKKSSLTIKGNQLGIANYKLTIRQSGHFDAEMESKPVKILTYVPLSEVKLTSPSEVIVNSSQTVKLTCEADGNPEPEFYWIKVGKYSIEKVSSDKTLEVGKSASEAGIYKCGAIQKLFSQETVFSSLTAVKVIIPKNDDAINQCNSENGDCTDVI